MRQRNTMKYILATLLLWGMGFATNAQDIDLFNSQGSPKAFISSDLTIYSWDGTPTAYIHQKGGIWYVYAFSGKHLGFYKNGAILNEQGKTVGAAEGKNPFIQVSSQEFPPKGEKQPTPNKQPRKAASSLAKTQPLTLEKAALVQTLVDY